MTGGAPRPHGGGAFSVGLPPRLPVWEGSCMAKTLIAAGRVVSGRLILKAPAPQKES